MGASLCGRRVLSRVRLSDNLAGWSPARNACLRFRDSVKKVEWAAGVASHQAIIDALRAGRVRAAGRELRAHIESHRARVETAT